MSRNSMYIAVALVVLLLIGGVLWRRANRPMNLLLITLDTTRADRLGCYGYAPARTPVLDGLAAEGVLFEQCRTVAPLTRPAHATMLTGLRPPEHGVRLNGRSRLPEGIPTLAEAASAAGYETAAFIASPVLGAAYGLARGFGTYDDREAQHGPGEPPPRPGDPHHLYRPGDQVADAAVAWLREAAVDPFVCWVHFYDPHEPYNAHPALFPEGFPHPYDAEIAFMDRQIGRVLAALEATGAARRTIIIAVGDHGEDLFEHGEPTHGMTLYDASLRVPLIVRLPKRSWTGRVPEGVEITDLYATMLDLLALPAEAPRGRSLRPALAGEPQAPAAAYAEALEPYEEYGWAPTRSLTSGGWKFIHSPMPELYNVLDDPGETNNRAAAMPDAVARFKSQLATVESGMLAVERETVSVGADERRRLASLGYAGGAGTSADAATAATWDGLADIKTMMPVYREGLVLYNRFGRSDDAGDDMVRDCHALIQRSPGTARYQRLMGDILQTRGQVEQALPYYERVLELNPNDIDTQGKVGVALCRLGRLEAGIIRLKAAVAADPQDAELCNNLGNALLLASRADEAVAHLEQAIALDADYVEARMNLGAAYSATGRHADAVDAASAALQLAELSGNQSLADRLRRQLAMYQSLRP